MDFAVPEERRRWIQAAKSAKSKGKDIDERQAESVSVGQGKVVAGVNQETSVVVIEDSVARSSKRRAAAGRADVWSVQVAGDVQSQSSMGSGGVLREDAIEVAKAAHGLCGQRPATVANAVDVADPEHAGDEVMTKVKEMIEKLKTKSSARHGDSDAEKMAVFVR